MRTIIKGKNFKVNDVLKQKVQEKLSKIDRHQHFANIKELEVEFSIEKNPTIANNNTVEITAYTKGHVIRAKEASHDMEASIDVVVDKLDRQIEKYKGKLYHSQNHKGRHQAIELKQEPTPKVLRKKRFSTRPVTLDEAILQIELLGHDFYVFHNAESGKINVLYYRKDGGLGLMEPE
ncbi:MAG: ribosome-associated translation inhibitor RaiA [Actinobacteria bacterium]|nr:MAG: ribosome-associated translation inhibitor RaiA [Actinomycetota bacterium]